ncbi:hypothetical protein TKV_c02300 [Thermoanaerobacter kivui]|uniref:Uncharacterized protein n=1 Tax=Thermoanaerobacter kivui TaxID=2325 RepID=A0A097ANP6_THEKI|nr:hypothetical protein [Thermoanaerobacter kivui]AIS51435.1 hypothetical protein TKV_c02300 [Thermoanaerobacter kivui]
MGDIQEIKQLMEQLAKSEKDKELASKKMQEVLEKSISEIKSILLAIKKYIGMENIKLRSYTGKTFETGEGIIIYDKSIEEKIILKPDNIFYHYKIENDELIANPIPDLEIHNYMSYDTLFESVKNSLKKCIQKNEEDIRIYKSTMLKIDKYNKELEEILSLKNSITNAIDSDKL